MRQPIVAITYSPESRTATTHRMGYAGTEPRPKFKIHYHVTDASARRLATTCNDWCSDHETGRIWAMPTAWGLFR